MKIYDEHWREIPFRQTDVVTVTIHPTFVATSDLDRTLVFLDGGKRVQYKGKEWNVLTSDDNDYFVPDLEDVRKKFRSDDPYHTYYGFSTPEAYVDHHRIEDLRVMVGKELDLRYFNASMPKPEPKDFPSKRMYRKALKEYYGKINTLYQFEVVSISVEHKL